MDSFSGYLAVLRQAVRYSRSRLTLLRALATSKFPTGEKLLFLQFDALPWWIAEHTGNPPRANTCANTNGQ